MWRPRQIVLIAGLCALAVRGAYGQALTEEQALARMRAEHPQVRVLGLTVREFEADARERSLLANPAVSYTREDTALGVDDFLLVTQELPVRGRLRLLGEAAGQAVSAAQSRADADLLTFETGVRLMFTDLLLAQERIAARESALAELYGLVEVLRAREEEGEGSLFDRLRAEREVADIEADLETAQINRLRAQARLAEFFAPGSDWTGLRATGRVADGVALPELAALPAQALARRPDYQALEFEEVRWEAERRAAERLRFPETSITAGWKRSDSVGLRASGYALTATLAVPLFNRGQTQITRAEVARARVNAEQLALSTRIESEVGAAHAAASRYLALASRYRAGSVDRAAELTSIATAAYEEGEYGILELLDAHRVKLGAELRLLDLSTAARRAAIELDRAIGRGMAP